MPRHCEMSSSEPLHVIGGKEEVRKKQRIAKTLLIFFFCCRCRCRFRFHFCFFFSFSFVLLYLCCEIKSRCRKYAGMTRRQVVAIKMWREGAPFKITYWDLELE